MEDRRFLVKIGKDIVATNMSIKVALVLVKALFEEYYADRELVISIEEIHEETMWSCQG